MATHLLLHMYCLEERDNVLYALSHSSFLEPTVLAVMLAASIVLSAGATVSCHLADMTVQSSQWPLKLYHKNFIIQ